MEVKKNAQDTKLSWLTNDVPLYLPRRKIDLMRVLCHLAFWGWNLTSIHNTFGRILKFDPQQPLNPTVYWVAITNHFLTTLIVFYSLAYFVVPVLMNQLVYQRATGKFSWGKLAFVGFCVILTFVFFNVNDYFLIPYLNSFESIPYMTKWDVILQKAGPVGLFGDYSLAQFLLAYNFTYVLLPLLLKTIREAVGWGVSSYREGLRNQQLTLNQLQVLNHQINPHFLFNNFNTIFGLIRKTNKEAAGLLHRLSMLLRYTLYKSSGPLVPLSGELEFMENYIMLEKSRRIDPERINFEITGQADSYQIPPLLLITFIENAFKHGLDEQEVGGWVTIKADIDNARHELQFTICNFTPSEKRESTDTTSDTSDTTGGGLGLANARQRLALAYDNQEYSFSITNKENVFTVAIRIRMS